MTDKSTVISYEPTWNNTIIELLSSMIFFITSLGIAIFIDTYTSNSGSTYVEKWYVFILVILMVISRRFNVSTPLHMVIHFLLAGVFLAGLLLFTNLLTVSINRVTFIFLILFNLIGSLSCVFRPKRSLIETTNIIFCVLINYFTYFGLELLDSDIVDINLSTFLINVFLAFLAYFIGRQLYEFEQNYYHSIRSSTIPVTQIRMQNYKTIFIILIGFFVALIGLFFAPLEAITKLIIAWLKYLFALLIKDEKSVQISEDLQFSPSEFEPGAVEAPKYVDILLIIFGSIIIVILIYLSVGFIINELHKAKTKFYKRVQDDYVTDEIEKLSHTSKHKSKKHDFGEGYEKSIRKKYYLTIKRAISKGVKINPSDSPDQISGAIVKETGRSIDELTTEYKKVRYNKD